jgi:uncharacterized coiled-coil DUF342 family protein
MDLANGSAQTGDSLALLEDKIRRAVELVTQLRQEKAEALAKASDSSELKTKVEELTREVESLRAEREVVRQRVGKLVEQIDALHGL